MRHINRSTEFIIGNRGICTYCGSHGINNHNVFHKSQIHPSLREDYIEIINSKGVITYSCDECRRNFKDNSIIFDTFRDRCKFANNAIVWQWNNIPEPKWTDHQKSQLTGYLSDYVESKQSSNQDILDRIKWFESKEFISNIIDIEYSRELNPYNDKRYDQQAANYFIDYSSKQFRQKIQELKSNDWVEQIVCILTDEYTSPNNRGMGTRPHITATMDAGPNH